MFSNLIIDLLVDLSQTALGSTAARYMIAALVRPDGLGAITGRSTCILPPGMDISEASKVRQWQVCALRRKRW